jgi:F-type H+-transporting ATPase subunit b
LTGGARAVHTGATALIFVTPAHAQTEPAAPEGADAHAPAEGQAPAETHAMTEAHGGEHGTFPPFDPTTYGSQLVWLVICFGALFLLMSRVALPRIGGILAEREGRMVGDLAEAARLKQETDAAIAAYEQALATARQNAHEIARKARDAAKAEIDADRSRIEKDLQGRLESAEAQIGEVKARAIKEVDAIAGDAAQAMVETLLGGSVGKAEIAAAVEAAKTGPEP